MPTIAPDIRATIIADSINPLGVRITSWELEYPRYIHSEVLTHRLFSRNSASSRAIPFERILEQVRTRPARPAIYTSESGKIGMQGGTELKDWQIETIKHSDSEARGEAMVRAQVAFEAGAHRSIVNRWIEPWMTIKIIATATNHHNFFALRCHEAALPDFQVLAWRMLDLYLKHEPQKLDFGQWHMPYQGLTPKGLTVEGQLKIATARACWVSYARPDKTNFEVEDAYKRHDECIQFGHMSPLEHCAKALDPQSRKDPDFLHGYPYSNFDVNGARSHWGQYRKTVPTECGTKEIVSLSHIALRKPEWITP